MRLPFYIQWFAFIGAAVLIEYGLSLLTDRDRHGRGTGGAALAKARDKILRPLQLWSTRGV